MADAAKKKKKLAPQFALTCATGALVIVGLNTYLGGVNVHDIASLIDGDFGSGSIYQRLSDTSIYKPLKVLMLGLPGAIFGAFLGYFVGDIMDNPRGTIPEWYMEQRLNKNKPKEPEEPIITGEELFLDDLGDDLDSALMDSASFEGGF